MIGPSGKYYIVDNDDGMRSLKCLISSQFSVINFFAVEDYELDLTAFALNIIHHKENYDVDVATVDECELDLTSLSRNIIHDKSNSDVEVVVSECEEGDNLFEFGASDLMSIILRNLNFLTKRGGELVSGNLEKFKELELVMTFKDMKEARQFINFYAVINKKGLSVKQSDSTRSRYLSADGCPSVCLISQDRNTQAVKIKTLKSKHTCDDAFKNKRADSATLAHYFKNKV